MDIGADVHGLVDAVGVGAAQLIDLDHLAPRSRRGHVGHVGCQARLTVGFDDCVRREGQQAIVRVTISCIDG